MYMCTLHLCIIILSETDFCRHMYYKVALWARGLGLGGVSDV